MEVTGVAAAGGTAPAITGAIVSARGPGQMPAPVPVSFAQLSDPQYEYKQVAVRGVIREAKTERPGLVALQIWSDGNAMWAKVPVSEVILNEASVDSEVRASGVLTETREANPSGGPTLLISDSTAIETVRPPAPPAELPISKIRALVSAGPAAIPAHRVRVRGAQRIVHDGIAVLDESGEIPVQAAQISANSTGNLDLAGFLVWRRGSPVLTQAVPIEEIPAEERPHRSQSVSVLTTVAQVHRLSTAAARQGFPVRLHAVVTFFDPGNHLLFVQDSTDGIFVEPDTREKLALKAGDAVEVRGESTSDFAPDVAKAHIKVLGHPGLPQAKRTSFGRAGWGLEDCHWIELQAIVQSVSPSRFDSLLTLKWGQNIFKAHVLAPAPSLMHLADAEVRLKGVCGALFNRKRQMLGIQMFVPDAGCIRILKEQPADPFSLATTRIADLLRFSRALETGHMVRVQGTVTYPAASGPTWVHDTTGGVMIQDHEAVSLAVGDQVEVAGFPEISGFSPALRGARVKRLRSGPAPIAIAVSGEEAMSGDYDGQLVQMEGKLIDRVQQPAEEVLTVASGETLFTAQVGNEGDASELPLGARLRLTGICSVEVDRSRDLIVPRAFRLLLRSPADVVLIGRPPLVTAGRVVPVLSGAALVIVAALAWAGLLRRRVRVQTFALRAQTVQLQAAHERTREALRKTREAEALELDSKRVLELIARDEPVEVIIDKIAEAVALHYEGATCAILLAQPQGQLVHAVPVLPSSWMEAFARIRFSSIVFTPAYRPPEDFADDPEWRHFMHSAKSRFRAFSSAPIVVDGQPAGVIAGFFRDEPSDKPCMQLGLWCNIGALALERRRLHDQLSFRAQHDGLTGLANRALLYERLEIEVERAARTRNLLGLLYIDLDGFKQINDHYGHDVGDALLREVAKRMANGIRCGDTVARIGGDEFVVLLPMLARREDAEQIGQKIAAAIREPVLIKQQRLSIGASVGIAVHPHDGQEPEELLRFADAQMYGEKGRRWYDEPRVVTPAASLTRAPQSANIA